MARISRTAYSDYRQRMFSEVPRDFDYRNFFTLLNMQNNMIDSNSLESIPQETEIKKIEIPTPLFKELTHIDKFISDSLPPNYYYEDLYYGNQPMQLQGATLYQYAILKKDGKKMIKDNLFINFKATNALIEIIFLNFNAGTGYDEIFLTKDHWLIKSLFRNFVPRYRPITELFLMNNVLRDQPRNLGRRNILEFLGYPIQRQRPIPQPPLQFPRAGMKRERED